MITRARIAKISKLAFPIAISICSAAMMSLINLAMVGTLGNNTIAAVGLSGISSTLMLAFVEGLVPAVQGIVARRIGEASTEPKCLPLNGGLWIVLAVGVPLTIVCYLWTPFFFSLISSDPEVTKIGVPFLRIECFAIVPAGIINAFVGYWTGMEKPKVFMLIGVFLNCLNIFVNYILIFGHFGFPALGARGAAIGWVLSLYAGVIISFAMVCLQFPNDGFLHAKPERPLLASIFKLAVPSTVLHFITTAGYVVFFWMVGQVGTAELAAANVLVKVMMMSAMLAMSLGMACGTLVSKAVGEGDLAGAAEWGWDTARVGAIGLALLGLPLFLFPESFLSIFLTDPHTISIAVIPLRLVAIANGAGSLVYILAYTLYSVGDGNRVMMIAFGTQWLFNLPLVWFVGPHLHYGLSQIWLVQSVYGLLAAVLITTIWAEGRWKRVKI